MQLLIHTTATRRRGPKPWITRNFNDNFRYDVRKSAYGALQNCKLLKTVLAAQVSWAMHLEVLQFAVSAARQGKPKKKRGKSLRR